MSIRTRKSTHPSKPPRSTQKLADTTLVTVVDGSPPLKTDLGRSDGGFSSSKPDIPDSTDETEERTPVLPRSVHIHQYSGEKFGSFWLDLVKFLVFLLRFDSEMKILLNFYLDPT